MKLCKHLLSRGRGPYDVHAAVITPGPVRTVKPHKNMTLLVEKVNNHQGRYRGDHLSHQIANKHRKATDSEEQREVGCVSSVPCSRHSAACQSGMNRALVSTDSSSCSKGTKACYGHRVLKNSCPWTYTTPTEITRRQSWRKSLPVAQQEAPTKEREKHNDITADKWRLCVSLVLGAELWLMVLVCIHTTPRCPCRAIVNFLGKLSKWVEARAKRCCSGNTASLSTCRGHGRALLCSHWLRSPCLTVRALTSYLGLRTGVQPLNKYCTLLLTPEYVTSDSVCSRRGQAVVLTKKKNETKKMTNIFIYIY